MNFIFLVCICKNQLISILLLDPASTINNFYMNFAAISQKECACTTRLPF